MKIHSKFGCLVLGAVFMFTSGQLAAFAQNNDVSVDKTVASDTSSTASGGSSTKNPYFPSRRKSSSSSDDWNGFYVGGYAGGNFNRSAANTSTTYTTTGYFAPTSVNAIATSGTQRIKPNGFNGGGTVGYNFQSGRYVFGLEADFGSSTGNKTVSTTTTYPCCSTSNFTVTQSVKTNWLMTARPRFGVTAGSALFYVTGGLAVTDVNYQTRFTDTFATASEFSSVKKTQAGWTGGAGMEYKVSKAWSFKGEYLYAAFPRFTTTSTNLIAFTPTQSFPSNVFTHSTDLKMNIVRFGINFHF